MKKILFTSSLVLILVISLWLFLSSSASLPSNKIISQGAPEQATPTIVPLHTQLGQLFMIGHWADTPVASTTALIQKYQLGGVVIMSAPDNPTDITNWVRQWNAVSPEPLLIAIDQEGGQVSRLKSANFTQTSQPTITSAAQAYEVGQTRGAELAALGINMNFAPVLDTASNPQSFMYARTFPSDTQPAVLAAEMVRGLAHHGVTGVVKHFPGHDDTRADSHTELPVVDISLAELRAFTQPFADIIQTNEPAALMTAHVQFPQIDTLPATLSPFFLSTYLRDELGYTGLIITDGMSMDAIDTHYSTEEASVLAIEAGANIILFAAEPTDIETVFPFLLARSTTSPLLQQRIADSYDRIQRLK